MLKKILRKINCGIILMCDPIAWSVCYRKKTSNVILIRLDAIGDFIIWLDTVEYLKKYYFRRKLHLVVSDTCLDLAKKTNYFDDFTVVNVNKFTTNLLYRWKLLRSIRKIGASIAIENVTSRSILLGDSIIRASGSKDRIGVISDFVNQTKMEAWFSSGWYTKTVTTDQAIKFEVDRNIEFLKGIGVDISVSRPVYYLPKTNKIFNKKYYVVSPGASWSGRRWPIKSFARLMNLIRYKYQMQGIICGDKSDYELGKKLEIDCDAMNLVGKTTLQEYIDVISGSHFIIANESSAIHIAPRVSVPSVCVLGGGHYGRFMPYPSSYQLYIQKPIEVVEKMECFGCNWNCIYERSHSRPVKCIEKISVESVYKEVIKIMDATTK